MATYIWSHCHSHAMAWLCQLWSRSVVLIRLPLSQHLTKSVHEPMEPKNVAFFTNCRSIILCKNCPWPFCQNGQGHFLPKLNIVRPKMCQTSKLISRNDRARPGPAGPGPREMVRMRGGPDLTKRLLFVNKNNVLGHPLQFLDVLDLKNGSGSKIKNICGNGRSVR